MESKDNIDTKVKEFCDISAKKFAKLIKEERKHSGLPMRELYKISGVSTSTINDIEKARYLPYFDVMLKLALSLKIPHHDVIDCLSNTDNSKNVYQKMREGYVEMIRLGFNGLNLKREQINQIINFANYTAGTHFDPEEFYS